MGVGKYCLISITKLSRICKSRSWRTVKTLQFTQQSHVSAKACQEFFLGIVGLDVTYLRCKEHMVCIWSHVTEHGQTRLGTPWVHYIFGFELILGHCELRNISLLLDYSRPSSLVT